jgi:outer membrane lipoprotein-sorting protein
MKKIFLFLLLLGTYSFAQSTDPNFILDKVKAKFGEVKDYVVNVKIKVDVDFLKAPVSEAKIYFKQPDKIHFESENFALLPKEGVNFSPMALLKKNYTAIYEKEDTINGTKTSVIKVIPLSDESDIILTTLWIDPAKYYILKAQSTTKINGTFSLELNYESPVDNFPLPSSMVFTFNIDRDKLSRGMRNFDEQDENAKKKEKKSTTGKVYIYYSDYKVNRGIPDSVFDEGKNK